LKFIDYNVAMTFILIIIIIIVDYEGVNSRQEGQRVQNSAVQMQCVVVECSVGYDCLT